jgi:hypothetical protein
MSREQGPRQAGMRPPANTGRARRAGFGVSDIATEGVRMSRGQGPRQAGMRPAANAGNDRHDGLGIIELFKEGTV